ncbi:GntR family transcriptional regulator [Spiractinospora alimapuensis]|nr:GntR family transcriptional regulator [Spiractinospora alimapuensis]QVQ54728.1 GntR family transcriptional regulator [Spiractinospora alimapuensis]
MSLFADVDRSSPVPLYVQIASRLEQAIHDRTLPPGARLENELSLCQRLGFSRPTVRRAIQDLVDKGLLVRRRGIGTQVVAGQLTPRKVALTSLYEDLATSGRDPRTTVLTHEITTPSEEVAATLGTRGAVLRIRRLRSAGDVPLAVLEHFLPSTVDAPTPAELETRGLYQVLRARGVTIQVARQRIGARAATKEESGLLEVDTHGPVLTAQRTAFNSVGTAVAFGRHAYRPDLYSFETTLVN